MTAKPHPRETRIAPPAWMGTRATREVMAALQAEGAVVRFVGGCVRDTLAGRPVDDIDIATTARPEANIRLLEAAGIKVVATGLKHGTVTAVSRRRPFEVTTLRIDVETYGRHARIAYTEEWRADAARRDFTMNALYADARGRVFDWFGGIDDLAAGRIRFVGDAERRIAEDRLRVLRYFRFHARYGRGRADRAAQAACARAAGTLGDLSGERIRAELLKLLAAPRPAPTLKTMLRLGVLAEVVPGPLDFAALARLRRLEPTPPDPLLRLAALLDGRGRAAGLELAARLRFSNRDRDRLAALLAPEHAPTARAGRRQIRRLAYHLGPGIAADRARLAGASRAVRLALEATPPPFPLTGRDVRALGIPAGPVVGELLASIEDWWIERDFAPARGQCLARLAALSRRS